MKVAIIGAGGFIGQNLAKEFNDTVLVDRTLNNLEKIKKCDVVINLAGATILKRWSQNYKKVLFDSRIETTKKVVEIINDSNVKYFISTSAIGIYPDNCSCDEESELGDNFLANLAKKWEEEAFKAKIPTSVLRLSVVLGEGGAIKQMLLPFKLNLGGTIGRGCNFMSFIDIRDLMRIYKFLIKKELTGVFNASTPFYTTNYEFTKTLAKALNKKAFFIIPPFFLKILYGEGAEVLLSSQKVLPKRLLEEGFVFKYPTIEKSLFSMFNHS